MTDALGGTLDLAPDLTLTRMGYGAMRLAGPGVWGPPSDPDEARAVLRAVVEAGVTHIDTSDFYGPHTVNALIRDTLHPYPDHLRLVTKVGAVRGPDASWNPASSPAELRQAVHDNLDHLGVEALDVVNLRLMDATGVTAGISALAELQAQGLIRHLGISNAGLAQVREAAEVAPVVCVQNEYNLAQRGDDELIDWCAGQGIAYVPFFPLGGFSPLQSDTLQRVADGLGATPMQIALAWLLQRSPNILLIPGTSSVAHLRENLAAAQLQLPAEAVAQLDAIGG